MRYHSRRAACRQLHRTLRQLPHHPQAPAHHGASAVDQHGRVDRQNESDRRLKRPRPLEQVRLHRRLEAVRYAHLGHGLRRQAVPDY